MSELHLSEEQLQRYALDKITDPAAVKHVADCVRCQMQIRAYQTLYSHIREAEEPRLDLKTVEAILDRLPVTNAEDRKEARYLYCLLFGAIGLLIAGLIAYWSTISRIFSGITAVALVLGLVLLSGVLTMQLMELYRTYREKFRALNP